MQKLKKVLLIGLAGIFCFAGQAFASEDTWTGPYLGVSAGTMIGTATSTEYDGPYDYGEYSLTSALGSLFGIQAGYNKQIGSSGLIGIELDFNLPDFDEERKFYDGDCINSAEWNYYSTLRLRGGLVKDNALFYVTGGVALVDVDYKFGYIDDPDDLVKESGTEVGYTAGAGVEFKVTENISVRGEYLYIGLPSTDSRYDYDDEPVDFESHAHAIKFGVNYLF